MFLNACATGPTTYRFAFGPRKELYTEKYGQPIDTSLAQQLGGTVTTVSGDREQGKVWTNGFQVGLSEELSNGITTMLFFVYNKYDELNYTFNSSNFGTFSETLSSEGTAFEGNIGYRWRWLRPNLSYKYENIKTKATVQGASVPALSGTQDANIFVWGGGLALDIPITTWLYLVLQADYRVPSAKGDDGTKSSYQSFQINLLVGNLVVGGKDRSSSKRKK